jgi:hypothetical protein
MPDSGDFCLTGEAAEPESDTGCEHGVDIRTPCAECVALAERLAREAERDEKGQA